jgi:hypothetical protein
MSGVFGVLLVCVLLIHVLSPSEKEIRKAAKDESQRIKEGQDNAIKREREARRESADKAKEPFALAIEIVWMTNRKKLFGGEPPFAFDDKDDVESVGDLICSTEEKTSHWFLDEVFLVSLWSDVLHLPSKPHGRLDPRVWMLKDEYKAALARALAEETPSAYEKARRELKEYRDLLEKLKMQDMAERKITLAAIGDNSKRAILQERVRQFEK